MLTPGDKAYLNRNFVTKSYFKEELGREFKKQLTNYPTRDELKEALFEQSTEIAQEFSRMRDEFLTKKEFMAAFSMIMQEFKALHRELVNIHEVLQAHTLQIRRLERVYRV